MRSSFPAMEKTAKLILKYGRTYELEKKIASIPKALNYII